MLSENSEFRIFTLPLDMFSSILYVRITCPVDLSHKSNFCEICLNWRQNLTAAVALLFVMAKKCQQCHYISPYGETLHFRSNKLRDSFSGVVNTRFTYFSKGICSRIFKWFPNQVFFELKNKHSLNFHINFHLIDF